MFLYCCCPFQAARSDSASTSGSTGTSGGTTSGEGGTSGDGDDVYYQSPELQALQEAMKELRAIVGEDPTDATLTDILMAADMDVNRALNFYFS